MSTEALAITKLVEDGPLALRAYYAIGVTSSDFPIYDDEFKWIEKRLAQKKTVNRRVFRQRFPDFEWVGVPRESAADLAAEVKEERAFEEVNALMSTLAENLERDNALELAIEARERLGMVTRRFAPSADSVLEDWEEDVEEMKRYMRAAKAGAPLGLKTGFAHLDHHWGGLLPGQFIELLGRTGEGKALALDTPLPTPDGWITMGEVQEGDKLFDELGQTCEVEWVGPITIGNCYRVKFSDGSSIVANDEHLWTTHSRAARKSEVERREKAIARGGPDPERSSRPQCSVRNLPSTVSTLEMMQTLHTPDGARNHAIRCTFSLDLPDACLPIAPYTLGVWLGDGARGTGQFTTMDSEVLDGVHQEGYETSYQVSSEKGHGRARNYTVRGIRGHLNDLGILRCKRIPKSYLRASHDQRLALLRGLMDTDGFWSGRSAEIGQVSKQLANDIYELVVSLGMKPTLRSKIPMLNGRRCRKAYLVKFSPTEQVFTIHRKAERFVADASQLERRVRRYVVAVEKATDVPVRCIRVSSPSHLFLAGRAMIPTHNSLKAYAMALNCKLQGAKVGIFTPELSRHEVKCRVHTLASAMPSVKEALGLKHSFRNRALLFRQNFNVKSYAKFCEYFSEELPGRMHLLSGTGMNEQMSVAYIEDRIVEYELDIVFVDPIYLLKPVRLTSEGNTYQETAWTAEALHRASETYGIPIVFTNQAHMDGAAGDAPDKSKSFGAKAMTHLTDYILGVKHLSEEHRMICRCTKSRFGQNHFRYEIGLHANTGAVKELTPLSGSYFNGRDDDFGEEDIEEVVMTAKKGKVRAHAKAD